LKLISRHLHYLKSFDILLSQLANQRLAHCKFPSSLLLPYNRFHPSFRTSEKINFRLQDYRVQDSWAIQTFIDQKATNFSSQWGFFKIHQFPEDYLSIQAWYVFCRNLSFHMQSMIHYILLKARESATKALLRKYPGCFNPLQILCQINMIDAIRNWAHYFPWWYYSTVYCFRRHVKLRFSFAYIGWNSFLCFEIFAKFSWISLLFSLALLGFFSCQMIFYYF